MSERFDSDALDYEALREAEEKDDDFVIDLQEEARRADIGFKTLEEAMNFMHPRVPADELIHSIRRRFISPAAFYEAPKHVLEGLGINRREALLFSQIPAITRYIERTSFGRRPRFKTLSAMNRYLSTLYTGLAIERFYLLCLDATGRMIDCILLQSGDEESAPFYLRDVLMHIVRTRAKAAVISHNHPNFSARPSPSDLKCTLALLEAMQPLGAVLLDHVIVCERECMSIRENGFIRQHVWLAQSPRSSLLLNWLD